jgi:hypothetical protein
MAHIVLLETNQLAVAVNNILELKGKTLPSSPVY